MLGNPDWFKRRKYGGWGIAPKTWQGWVYVLFLVLPFAVFQALPFWSVETRIVVTFIWLTIVLVDVFDIMIRMKLDERERLHEAISERNALWVMMILLTLYIVYQAILSSLTQDLELFDPVLAVILIAAVVTKAATNLYLEHKN